MSNKALSVGSRGTIQHSASPHAVWASLDYSDVYFAKLYVYVSSSVDEGMHTWLATYSDLQAKYGIP